jgi:hypothetical protein
MDNNNKFTWPGHCNHPLATTDALRGALNMETTLIEKLQQDLTNFGLNPAEWSLKSLNKSYFRILHKTDSGFSFLGHLDRKEAKPRWKKLELFSI